MDKINEARKAIAALITSVVALSAQFGYTSDWASSDYVQAISVIVAPFVVYYVANKKGTSNG